MICTENVLYSIILDVPSSVCNDQKAPFGNNQKKHITWIHNLTAPLIILGQGIKCRLGQLHYHMAGLCQMAIDDTTVKRSSFAIPVAQNCTVQGEYTV